MTTDTLIMFAGAFVVTLPFLGFPNSWDNTLFFLAGVFIISLGIVVRRRRGHSSSAHATKDNSTFVANVPLHRGDHEMV